jgi:DNA-binding response OmpR family regulator
MTGFGPTGLRVKAAELAVDYLMQKPFEVDDLLAIASQLLSPQ